MLYGFSSQLLEHMALKAVQPDAETRFSLEEAFTMGGADKLAWVNGWRKLPHVPRDVAKLFEYPQQFAEEAFARVERALRVRASAETPAAKNGQLLIVANDADATALAAADLSAQYVLSSNRQVVAENKARACDETELINSRTEGEFLVSYRTSAGWVAISKDVLTDVLGAGRNARIVGLPRDAARVLQLMCPELVAGRCQGCRGCPRRRRPWGRGARRPRCHLIGLEGLLARDRLERVERRLNRRADASIS